MSKIRRALLSVSDKTGVADLARALHELGVELLSDERLLLRAGERLLEFRVHRHGGPLLTRSF